MGEAYNEHGDVLGSAMGRTKAEVFAKLDAAHPDANEVRIRTGEAIGAAVDKAFSARDVVRVTEEARRAGNTPLRGRPLDESGRIGNQKHGNGGAGAPGTAAYVSSPIGESAAGPSTTAFDPVQTLIDRVLSLPHTDRLRLAEALAIATAKDLIGGGAVERGFEAVERELRERAATGRAQTQAPTVRRTFHDRIGLMGQDGEEVTLANVDEFFGYVSFSKDQGQRGDVVRELLAVAAKGILRNVPSGVSRDVAMRNLMIVRMLCNQAIAFNGRI